MKRTLLSGVIAVALFGGGAIASAMEFTDTVAPFTYLSAGHSYSGTFDIRNAINVDPPPWLVQFNPQTMDVTSVDVKFWFIDDLDIPIIDPNRGPESASITLGGQTIASGRVDFSRQFEGTYGTGAIYGDIQDGVIAFTVTATAGDFIFNTACLTAEAEYVNGTPTVPEGGTTVALLGLGLVVILGAKRRFAMAS